MKRKPEPTVEVDKFEFYRLKMAVDEMQGHVFFCQDDEGTLRRWFPPRPYRDKESD